MVKSRLSKLSNLFKQYNLDNPEERMTWPPTKEEEAKLLQQTPRKLPKQTRPRTSRRGQLYQTAKEQGYTTPYKRATIKDLNNYLFEKKVNHWLEIAKREPAIIDISFLLERPTYIPDFLRDLPRHYRYGLEFGERLFPLNERFFNRSEEEQLEGVFSLSLVEKDGSDLIYIMMNIETVDRIRIIPMTQSNAFSRGGFFPYKLKEYEGKYTELYERYRQNYLRYVRSDEEEEVFIDCLGHALNQKFPDLFTDYTIFRRANTGTTLQANRLSALAKDLNIKIILHKKRSNEKSLEKSSYNNNCVSNKVLEIALFEGHYFLYEDTELTSNEINMLTGGRIRSEKNRKKINSYTFLRQSIEKKLVEPFTFEDWESATITRKWIFNEITPQMIKVSEGHVANTPHKKKDKENKDDVYAIYFDTETYEEKKGGIFTVYQLSFTYKSDEDIWYTKTIDSIPPHQIIRKFFEYIKKIRKLIPKEKKIICVAHNLAFDIQSILRYNMDGLKILTRIGSSMSSCKTMTCQYYGIKIYFQDSYSFLTMKLSDFTEAFHLETKKGPFPYDAMDRKTVEKRTMSLKKAKLNIPEDQHKDFEEAAKQFMVSEKRLDIIAYSKYYCELDVKLLREGFEIFRKAIKEEFNVEALHNISTPSLGKTIINQQSFFQKIPSVTGSLREYISKTCVGGRTVLRDNEPQDCRGQKLSDLDVTSLYPYAFTFMTDVPISEPKMLWKPTRDVVFTNINDLYDELYIQRGTWLFCDVEIIEIRKPRHIPSLSVLDREKGVREWGDKPGRYTLNHIQLEDLCNFQEISFKLLGGVFYPKSSQDVSFKEFFENLFSKRAVYKKDDNPLELVYKLLMNSQHGKMTQNPISKTEIFMEVSTSPTDRSSEEEFNKFLSKHYHEIIEVHKLKPLFVDINNTTRYRIVKSKSIEGYTNQCQIASVMYAYSKRVMNQAIYLAEDNGMKVYYTDTDSMFMDKENVSNLEVLYEQKYGRAFQGKGLGYFHSDYKVKETPNSDTYAQGIFFGKKAYFIQCHYESSETQKPEVKYIERMKGVPNATIKEYYRSNNANHYELLNLLAIGSEVEFDLKTNQVRFEVNKDFEYSKKDKFIRKVRFPAAIPISEQEN